MSLNVGIPMKMMSFFLSLIMAFSSLADCNLGDGTVLKEGEGSGKKSLFDQGGVFTDQKNIDQDDLATCYAVGATTALKTVLPGNPDLSYHHAALKYSTSKFEQKFREGTDTKYEGYGDWKSDSVVDYGNVCGTIKAMQSAGGACLKGYSQLESHPSIDPEIQGRAQHGLGKYFDYFNKYKDDSVKLDELKKGIEEAVKVIQKERTEGKILCQQDYVPVENGLNDIAFNMGFDEVGDSCPGRKAALNKMCDAAPDFSTVDRMKASVKPEFMAKLDKFLGSDPELSKDLSAYFKATGGEPSHELSIKFTKKLGDFFKAEFPLSEVKDCKSMIGDVADLPHPFLLFGNLKTGKQFLEKAKLQKSLKCSAQDIESAKTRAKRECTTPNMDMILDAVMPLVELGESIDKDKILAQLTNPVSQGTRQIEDALLQGCASNQVSLDGVTCENYTMCRVSAIRGYDASNYNGRGNCYPISKAKQVFSKQALEGINANRAVNLSVCTAFMENPGVKTQYCHNNPDPKARHSYHSMTLTGYRCKKGKIEYEVFNSWGKACPKASEGEKPAMECVRDEAAYTACMVQKNASGRSDQKRSESKIKMCQQISSKGRFWVSEDILVENTMTISPIKAGK